MSQRSDAQAITPELLAHLQTWQGRREVRIEPLSPQPVTGLSALLNADEVSADDGSALPPLWHWAYFTPCAPQSELGPDGHPRLGGFMPPVPLPRRMWAGGRLQWHGLLPIGARVQKTTTIESIKHKAGRSGDLVFALLRHELSCDDVLLLSEEQDIVYRAPPAPGEPAPAPTAAPTDALWSREIHPDPVQLFRYSALTFNAHRIHYDRPYAIGEEGYPGLVVHGPLIATLLAELAREATGGRTFRSFGFRAVRPLIDTHSFRVCGRPTADGQGAELWAQDHEGWLAMQAEVQFG